MGLQGFHLAAQLGRFLAGCCCLFAGAVALGLSLGHVFGGAVGFLGGGLALLLVRLLGGFGLGLHLRQFGA